jgi:hypothetical protein
VGRSGSGCRGVRGAVWCFVSILIVSGLTASSARSEITVPGTTATLRWSPALGADGSYFVYVSRNGAIAKIEAGVTKTEVTLTASPGDVVTVSVAAVRGAEVGPRSAPSEPLRFGSTPPPPGRLVMSCATCGVSALVRFPTGTTFGLWPHPAGTLWDLLQIGRFTSSAQAGQALLRDRASGGWLIGTLGADSLTPVTSIVKLEFAASSPLSADLDGDGVLEILIQDREDNDIEVWQAISGTLRRELRLPLGGAFTPIALEDLDGDGQRDLWFQHDGSGIVGVTLTRNLAASGSATIATRPPAGYTRVHDVADYNGDGVLDLLWRSDEGRLAVALLGGNRLQPTSTLRPLGERAGDNYLLPRTSFDLDGAPGAEVVMQNTVDGSVHALWADTSGRRQLLYLPPGGARWEVLQATR